MTKGDKGGEGSKIQKSHFCDDIIFERPLWNLCSSTSMHQSNLKIINSFQRWLETSKAISYLRQFVGPPFPVSFQSFSLPRTSVAWWLPSIAETSTNFSHLCHFYLLTSKRTPLRWVYTTSIQLLASSKSWELQTGRRPPHIKVTVSPRENNKPIIPFVVVGPNGWWLCLDSQMVLILWNE